MDIKIVYKQWRHNQSHVDYKTKNQIILAHEHWDDFGYQNLYEVHYVDNNMEYYYLGETKIMSVKSNTTIEKILIENDYKYLDDSCASIGLFNFYENLMSLDDDIKKYLLEVIKDCIYNPSIFNKFEDSIVMKTSLLRDTNYEDIKEEYSQMIFQNQYINTRFSLGIKLDRDIDDKIIIDVHPDSTPPTNIHAFIGRNSSGKTQLLEAIFKYYYNYINDLSYYDDNIENNFYTKLQLFNIRFKQIIYIPININNDLKDIMNTKNRDIKIIDRYDNNIDDLEKSLKICLNNKITEKLWKNTIKKLETDPLFKELELANIDKDDIEQSIKDIINKYKKSSSGHKFILLTITKIVEMITPKSLVIIDEPENHLHPPLLASLIRAMSYFLIQRNGFAILATHSPVVLQEIPKSCVYVLNRFGNEISIRKPSIETFAENIGTLTREVFRLEVENSGFYEALKEEVNNGESYEGILKKYDNQIGLEGRSIIATLLANKDY
ncbi:AAA family ATPase [Brachyspira pilosicoli]|uniref:ATPase AAA-type core domain-containing protein n=1 Tax=Brachyspira pilosicoli P43/6/78 TaxID=1042417 RepID=A0A3B6VWT6_BRAPL|nr:AAA family ATPase [Brachyspira pilosicoli]AGA67315.1 hypothetical protein BPP43_10755 [Brachyspira pilosicoli P43/6/78]PLV56569.1 hypothetical protein BPSP16_10245 [Brachyspira pilosicoli SP16]WIH81118.1 ATP-binding protein [Brachyspira pilosicoli]SUW04788.1 Predicted ATP-binding protein involved in virulence [Brachyspira pilosicoli]